MDVPPPIIEFRASAQSYNTLPCVDQKKNRNKRKEFEIPLEKPFCIRSQVFSRSKFDLIRYLNKTIKIFNKDRTNLLMSIYSGIHPIKALKTRLESIAQEINDQNLLKIDA